MNFPSTFTARSEAIEAPVLSRAERSLDLRRFWPPIYRSRWAVLAIMAAALSLAVVITLITSPIYRATSTVEIREEARKVLGTEDQSEGTPSAQSPELFLQTQLNIVQSRSTIAAVARSLNLYNDDRFFTAMHAKPPTAAGSLILTPRELRNQAVEKLLRDNMDVSFSKSTRIARIQFDSPDPRLAARIANSFAENYIRLNLDRRFDASRYSLQFLREQIQVAQSRLGTSERAAIDFARQARLVDASNAASQGSATNLDANPRSLTTANLVQLNQSYSEAVARRLAAEEKWRRVQSTPVLDVTEVAASPVVQQLLVQRAQIKAQVEQQLQTRQNDYPLVQQLRGQLAEIDRQVQTNAANIRDTVRTEYATALDQEKALKINIERLKTTTLDEQDRSIRLSILQREVNSNRQLLGALLTRYNDLNAQSGVQTNNLSVIDEAEVPTLPVWPKVPLNIVLALLTGGVIAAVFVAVREHLFEMIRTPQDVSDRLNIPALGAVPVAADILRAMLDTKTSVAEALNSIRTSLSLSGPGGIPKSLMVTSTEAGEGKSTTCYGLATGFARLGRRVVIIDADLRRPNVHRIFALGNESGLGNALAGEVSIGQVIHSDVMPGIDVVTAGPVPPSPTELLTVDRLSAVVEELAAHYDHVLIDSAPVLGLADAPLVAQSVDGIVFVIESAKISVRGATSALGRLQQTGRPVLGAILSRFDADQQGFSYDYKYDQYSYGSKAA